MHPRASRGRLPRPIEPLFIEDRVRTWDASRIAKARKLVVVPRRDLADGFPIRDRAWSDPEQPGNGCCPSKAVNDARDFAHGAAQYSATMNMSNAESNELEFRAAFVPMNQRETSGVGAMIESESPEAIGHRLAVVREVYGMKQYEFAKEAGIQPNTYNQIEKGENYPSLASAKKLCKSFNITLDYIYFGKTDGLPLHLSRKLMPKASGF